MPPRSALYDDLLRDWHRIAMQVTTRVRTEVVWLDFEPGRMHSASDAGRPQLEGWADEWIDRGDLPPEHGSTALLPAAFEAAQAALEIAVAALFAEAPRLPKAAPEGRPLRSTIACSSTMDNNFGERAPRGPGQRAEARLRFRQHGRLSAVMYTAARSGLDVLRWRLRGERRPGDLSPRLP